MNTEHNNPTRSTDNAHEGQTDADNNYLWPSSKPPVCPYSRKKALADGLQKEVPLEYLQQLSVDWDMLLPSRVFLTKKVIECCQLPDGLVEPEEKCRLWEILNVLEVAIGNSFKNRIALPVSFGIGKRAPDVWLCAVWSTADMDDPTDAITIMMPDEI